MSNRIALMRSFGVFFAAAVFLTVAVGGVQRANTGQANKGNGAQGNKATAGGQGTTAGQGNRTIKGTPDSGVGGILISPALMRMDLPPGVQKRRIEFRINNPNTDEAVGIGRIVPVKYEERTYMSSSQPHERDCSAWITPKEINKTLKRGDDLRIPFQIDVPPTARGVYWCALQFSSRPTRGSANMPLVVYEVPIIISVAPPGQRLAKASVEIGTMSLEVQSTESNAPHVLKMDIKNIGDSLAKIGLSGALRNTRTGQSVQIKVSERYIFPHTTRTIDWYTPRLSDGVYQLTITPEVGTQRLNWPKTTFVIKDGKPTATTPQQAAIMLPLEIDPQGFFFDNVIGGATKVKAVRMYNRSDRTITLTLTPKSVSQSVNGSIGSSDDPIPAGITVVVQPNEVSIPPKQNRTVQIRVTASRAAKGDLWFGVDVAEKGAKNSLPESIVADVQIRNTLQPKLDIFDTVVTKSGEYPTHIDFKVRNSGTMALMPAPVAYILMNGLQRVATVEVPILGDGGLLPGTVLENSIQLPPDLKPGDYVVQIKYQYSETADSQASVPIKVPAPKATKGKSGGGL